MIPRFDSVCPIFAVSLRSRKWQAIAISQPPPVAWPLTATKASSRSNFSVSYAIARDSFEEDGGDGIGGVGEPVRALPEDPRGRELVHRAEQHLGGDLHVQVAPDPASGDPLLEDRLDHVE